jgi:hypothetical protein
MRLEQRSSVTDVAATPSLRHRGIRPSLRRRAALALTLALFSLPLITFFADWAWSPTRIAHSYDHVAWRARTPWSTAYSEMIFLPGRPSALRELEKEPAQIRRDLHAIAFDSARTNPAWFLANSPDDDYALTFSVTEFGAPFRCFYHTSADTRPPGAPIQRTHGLLELRAQGRYHPPLRVATIPLWPQLLANLFVYTLAWFAIITLLARTRSHRRLRRGLCASCAYDVQGARACPECGWLASNT